MRPGPISACWEGTLGGDFGRGLWEGARRQVGGSLGAWGELGGVGSEAALEAGALHPMSGDPREQDIGGEVGVGGLQTRSHAGMQASGCVGGMVWADRRSRLGCPAGACTRPGSVVLVSSHRMRTVRCPGGGPARDGRKGASGRGWQQFLCARAHTPFTTPTASGFALDRRRAASSAPGLCRDH